MANWQPADGPLLTKWASDMDPLAPLPEYPRPQLVREQWVNLNGFWDYAIVPREQERVDAFDGQIVVPFAVESALSGVGRAVLPSQRLWYRRTFANPTNGNPSRRVLLHFGAVDYRCDAWVNGVHVGEHAGGYLPFTFDITDALRAGENELRVAAWDPTDKGLQPYGKQTLRPRQIWYTAVTGIWQTVWLEVVPQTYIAGLKITPDLDAGRVAVEVQFGGRVDAGTARMEVYNGGALVAEGTSADGLAVIAIPQPHPWSPDDPHLYDLVVRAGEDEVRSYFALRKFSLEPDAAGHVRFHLNNKPLFLYGPLDQGYWPDGLYTAPTDEALRFDLEWCKRAGVNFIRKHVKVEPLRWYYHCDRLGLIVWQDMPNGGRPVSTLTTLSALLFDRHRRDTGKPRGADELEAERRRAYRTELAGMIELLYNSPCIAAWVPFNEGWGQFDAREITDTIKALDPSRSVDHASGWFEQECGDYCSRHIYYLRLDRRRPPRDGRAYAISEFGAYGLVVPGHVWHPTRKFSIRFYDTPEALARAYRSLVEEQLRPLIAQGLAAAVYTQLTDVEVEVNGWLTYDRAVEKIPAESLAALHRSLFAE